jgi:ABC-type transport system involved in cytochrome c biogenesis permease subunit
MTFGQLYIPVAAAYAAAFLLHLGKKRRPALWALLTAFSLHAVFLAVRSLSFGFFNSGAILEEQVFLPFSLAGIGLWLRSSRREEDAAAVSVVAAVVALLALPIDKGVIPPSPKSVSPLVPVFFFCEILAHALFIAAAALAVRRARGQASLPQAHRFAVWGFVLFSAAQVSGAAWCYLGWSVPFQWGFRHLHSAAVWCFFANYIHLRFLPWWNDRRKAAYLAAGALLLAAYLAVLQFIEAGQVRIGG